MGDPAFGPEAHLFEGDRFGVLLEDEGRDDLLLRVARGDADHGDVLDPGEPADRRFDLTRVDVESAGEDELLLPVGHADEAVVEDPDIARAEPAVLGEDPRGLLGRVEVAVEDLRSSNEDLARFARVHITTGILQVDQTDPGRGEGEAEDAVPALIRQRGAHEDGRGLREAVALDDHPARGLLPALRRFRRQGHRPGDGVADRGQGCSGLGRAALDAFEHRRDADEEGDGPAPVRIEGEVDIELRQDDLGRGLADGGAAEEGEAEGVEEGEERPEGLGALMELPDPEEALIDVRPDVPVGEGHRLGDAVRPSGVEDDGAIRSARTGDLRIDAARACAGVIEGEGLLGAGRAHLRLRGPRLRQRRLEEHAPGCRHETRDVDGEERVERGRAGRIRLRALLPDDRHLRAVAPELLGDLCGGGERVVLGDDRADAHARVEDDEGLRGVGQGDGDDIAPADAGRDEDRGGAQGHVEEFRIGELAPEVVDGRAFGVEARRRFEQAEERALGHGDLIGAARIVEAPGFSHYLTHREPPSGSGAAGPIVIIILLEEGRSSSRPIRRRGPTRCRRSRSIPQ